MREMKEKPPLDGILAETSREARKTGNFPSRISRYGKAHQRTLEMSEYISSVIKDNHNLARQLGGLPHRLQSCGEYLLFRNYYTIEEIRLHKASFCMKHLLCPLCAMRRTLKVSGAYLDRFNTILLSNPGLEPYFVTVTSQNGPDLSERFDHNRRSYKKMTEQRYEAARGRRSLIEMNKALGGVHTFEVKKGSGSGQWHVHNHAIWLCREKPWETRLSDEWKEITGDSYIVDVKPLDKEKDPLLMFFETFSYALKLSTLTKEENLAAFRILAGKRMINSFGLFRGVQVPEDLNDIPLEDLPYIELLYRYMHESSSYHKAPSS